MGTKQVDAGGQALELPFGNEEKPLLLRLSEDELRDRRLAEMEENKREAAELYAKPGVRREGRAYKRAGARR